jgi:FAD:protein FMN transferase
MTALSRTVHVEPVMGTVASFDVRDDVPEAIRLLGIRAAAHALRCAEERFSAFRPDSEVCRHDRGELAERDRSAELREVLDLCAALEADSAGVFRARTPGTARLDVAGVVKGWAIDRAGAALRDRGLRRWCLAVGGDVLVAGAPEPGRAWRVAVRDPGSADRVTLVLPVVDAAVATSGTYERGRHLWDGRDGRRRPLPGSTTVVGPSMTTADAYATVAHALGVAGCSWVARHPGHEAVRVEADGSVVTTLGVRVTGARVVGYADAAAGSAAGEDGSPVRCAAARR